MLKLSTITAHILITTMLAAGVVHAQNSTDVLQKRVKISLNAMVQDVREAPTADAKRVVLEQFITKIDRGTGLVQRLPFLTTEHHAALEHLQTRFDGYATVLHGTSSNDQDGTAAVADSDLDAFASFMQNDLEQAQSGGVYLSTGAIIIVLLIILIIL
jgi:hypothetical protein